MAKLRERNSNFINDASSYDELELKVIVPRMINFFKENKENKVFKDLKDETYYKNLKKDIEENRGIENPVICFEDGTLVEGHSRIKLLKELIEEGKIPSDYEVPTIFFQGTKEEGTKRLILGNLNRFEIDPDTRTLLFARVYPGYFDPNKTAIQKGGETVSPTRKQIASEMNLSEKQVRNEKAKLKEAIEKTKKPLEKLEPKDLKEVREEKNQERREKTQAKKEPISTKTPSPGAKEPSKNQVKPLRPHEMTTKGRELSRKYEYPKGRVGTPSHNQAIEKQFEKFKKESVSTVFGYYEIYNFLTDGKSFDEFIEMIRREKGIN
jgi:hypothetical protein